MKLLSNLITSGVFFIYFASCASVDFKKGAVMLGEVTGNNELVKAAGEMTPQQEYFLGRSIMAQVLSDRPLTEQKYIQAYVNFVGQFLSYHSIRPELFIGYRFGVINESLPMALSTPGGFIIISKGMIELIENEDELAAVLAHEVAHISLRHAEKNIKNSNQLSIGKKFFTSLANNPDNKDLKSFADSVSAGLDMSYNQEQEIHADQEAILILRKAGYAPTALKKILDRIPQNNSIISKHPLSTQRLQKVVELAGTNDAPINLTRQTRFVENTKYLNEKN